MPRELTSHKVNGCNDELTVRVMDEPGHGGACHQYVITGPKPPPRLSRAGVSGLQCEIDFQNGPIKEHGTNGITHEALLAILIDRLDGFQSGPFANTMNQIALDSLRTAQRALKHRTEERLARGVEGTHQI